jgi:hypothetical protein
MPGLVPQQNCRLAASGCSDAGDASVFNFIERSFGETRRRAKVIGRLPGESSCLSLVWAVLDRAACGWRGLTMTPRALRLLQDYVPKLLHPG